MSDESKTVVQVRHGSKGVCHSNILWSGKFPMRNGRFPNNHPCAVTSDRVAMEMGSASNIEAFRERGYWASCFPEGDGIVFSPEKEQSREQVEADIRECFGWDVTP